MDSKELKDTIAEQQALVKEQLEKVSGGHHKITIESIIRQPDCRVKLSCLECGSEKISKTDEGILCNDCGYLYKMEKWDLSQLLNTKELFEIEEDTNPGKE